MKKILIFILITLSFVVLAAKEDKSIQLNKDNFILINSEINAEVVSQVKFKAQQMDQTKTTEPIYLILNTPGGEILSGMELIDFLKNLNRQVHTIAIYAASMGFHIMQGLGDRYMVPFAVLMSHKASGGVQGEMPGQIESRYNFFLKMIESLDVGVVARTKGKQTLKSYKDAYRDELWINGQEAIDKGYADKVVSVKCGEDLSGTYSQKMDIMGYKINIKWSDCPLITSPLSVELDEQSKESIVSENKDNLNKIYNMIEDATNRDYTKNKKTTRY